MERKHCRYSDDQLRSLGLSPETLDYKVNLVEDGARETIESMIFGQFKSVIELLFGSKDGNLDYQAFRDVTSNSSPVVQQFAANILLRDITPVDFGDMTDDQIFDTLIPRSMQSQGDISPYLDKLKDVVSLEVEQYKQDHPDASTTSSNS